MHRRYGFRWINFKKRKKEEHEKLKREQDEDKDELVKS